MKCILESAVAVICILPTKDMNNKSEIDRWKCY